MNGLVTGEKMWQQVETDDRNRSSKRPHCEMLLHKSDVVA
jgi:hypothetical protein